MVTVDHSEMPSDGVSECVRAHGGARRGPVFAAVSVALGISTTDKGNHQPLTTSACTTNKPGNAEPATRWAIMVTRPLRISAVICWTQTTKDRLLD